MQIDSAEAAFRNLLDLRQAMTEEFWVLSLTAGKRLIEKKMIFRGAVDHCPIHPREIFRFAILSNASCILVAHNHPHEDVTPSFQDIQVTRNLIKASKIVGIPTVDHLILAKDKYLSLAECGLFGSKRKMRES